MNKSVIIMIVISSVIYLKSADCAVLHECFGFYPNYWPHKNQGDIVTNIWCEKYCRVSSVQYQFSGTISTECYCRPWKLPQLWNSSYLCTDTFECPGNRSEICGGSYNTGHVFESRITVSKIEVHLSTETVTPKNTKATIAMSVSMRTSTTQYFSNLLTSTTSTATVTLTQTSGNWGMWNDWRFCEVNCVREDTTNGIQRRWRTCNGAECYGNDMEERTCTEPAICKGMRPRKLLCKCPKRLINKKWHFLDGKNITDDGVRKMVVEDFNKNIISEISVDKKTVSKEVRKKNSSVNKRKSSQSIGWGCIVLLILPVVFLVAIDILNCCIHFQSRLGDRKRNRIGPTLNIQDLRDSSKPLQENINITESSYASRCGNDFHPDEVKLKTYSRGRDDNNEEDRDKWLQYM